MQKSDPRRLWGRTGLARFYRSRAVVVVLMAALLPLWGSTRLAAWTLVLRTGPVMNGSEILLGAAAAPGARFLWYYDERARQAFLAKRDPFAVWQAGNPAAAEYVHIPPWEPGLAIPLRLAHEVFGAPLSLTTLVGIQLGVDVVALGVLGLLAFNLGGPLAAGLAMWIYAGWNEAASAAAAPFYYYWPIPFGLGLVGALAAVQRGGTTRRWWAAPLAVGFLAGAWCWFRGTGITIVMAAPVLVAFVMPRRKMGRAATLALVGSAVALAPSAYHHWPRSGSLLPRSQVWHDLYVGLGTRPNPFGVIHQDEAAMALVARKYGVAFHEPGYEEALRREYLSIVRRNPGLVARNVALNLIDSMSGWSFTPDPSAQHAWFWLGALLGLAALVIARDPRSRVLAGAFAIWAIECATIAVVKRPQAFYLWETVGLSVLCGAAGVGAALELLWRALSPRMIGGQH